MSAVRNRTTGELVATRVDVARNPWSRTVGLLGRASLAPDEGLWIDGCSAIHTLGMRATLDVIFLDAAGAVVRIASGIAPNRPVVRCAHARTVLELGAAAARAIALGDRLVLE